MSAWFRVSLGSMTFLASLAASGLLASAPVVPRQRAPLPSVQQLQMSPSETIAREFVASFVTGRFDVATKDFNATMKTTVTPAVLKDMKDYVDREMGMFRTIKAVNVLKTDGFKTTELVCQFAKSAISVRVVFDNLGRVGALYMSPMVEPAVDPKLEASARALLTNFVAGEYAGASKDFNNLMQRDLNAEAFAKLGQQVKERYGAFRNVRDVKQRSENGFRTIELYSTYENGPVAVRVVFDVIGRISGVHISPDKSAEGQTAPAAQPHR
jgi:hypothetical protein